MKVFANFTNCALNLFMVYMYNTICKRQFIIEGERARERRRERGAHLTL